MRFSSKEKTIITDVFFKVQPISAQVVRLFYARLFEIAPDTKVLFEHTDMEAQGIKFTQALATILTSLIDPVGLRDQIRALGERHIAYGVMEGQYQHVGQALIWAFEQALGDEFTPEAKRTWVKVYGMLASMAMEAYDKPDDTGPRY